MRASMGRRSVHAAMTMNPPRLGSEKRNEAVMQRKEIVPFYSKSRQDFLEQALFECVRGHPQGLDAGNEMY
jgi:hypothetical protein